MSPARWLLGGGYQPFLDMPGIGFTTPPVRSVWAAAMPPAPSARTPLPPRHVEVWWSSIDLPPAELDALRADLDEGERARISRLAAPDDRRRAVVAHGLLRRRVARLLGVEPVAVPVVRHCMVCGAHDHGKPAVGARDAPEVSLTHAGTMAAVAISTAGPVGIDLEPLRRDVDWSATRRHVFSVPEWDATAAAADPQSARLWAWTRKEAAAKATGHGLAAGLERVAVGEAAGVGGWRDVAMPTEVTDATAIRVLDLDLGPAWTAAVAVVGADLPPTLTVCPPDT